MRFTFPYHQQTPCNLESLKKQILPRSIFTYLLLVFFAFSFSSVSFGQGYSTVDFQQAQNDRNGAKTYNIDWVYGILNSTHTDYFEGVGIPQRIVLTGIQPNNANANPNKHSLRFQVLAEKGGKHAYDFPISWDQAFKTAQDIGNGSVNELQNLFIQQCDAASSASGAAACGALSTVTGAKVQIASFPDLIGNPGRPTLGDPSVNSRIRCFEDFVKAGVIRYGDRTIEIRGNQDISNVSVTFNGYKGSGNDLAEYTILWESSSDMVMIRFATHLSAGIGNCGYGSGQGAGSINGGPYHVILQRLDDRDNKSGVSLGNQDNQIMAGAIKIPPPTCNLSDGASGCANTATSFTVNYSSTDAAGATVKFYFLTNTAGAKLPNATTAAGSCSSNNFSVTADANGNASVTITPSGAAFTAGSFRVGGCVTSGSSTVLCEQPTATTLDAATVAASVNNTATTLASPFILNILQLNPQAALTSLGTLNGVQNNALFSSFTWAPVTDIINNATNANLSSTNGANVTFTPTSSSGGGVISGLYVFEVTAISSVNGCITKARVFINASGQATCPGVSGPNPVCANVQGLTYTAGAPSPGDFLTYVWSLAPTAPNGTTNGASISGATEGVQTITVNAGTGNFTVVLKIRADNGTVFELSNCRYPVTVNANPTCNITGADAVCAASTGNQYSSTVNPSDGTISHSWTISGNGSITSAINGPSVTVTAGATGSFTLIDNINRNGCLSSCTKTVTVNAGPTCTISGADAVCAASAGNQYSSTVSPSDGTISHSWTISGNGSIIGATNGTSVNVTATGEGSFTLTDNIIRNGCASSCSKTVTVNAMPTCTITGADAVCAASTGNVYSSSVSPSGGTVTHSWSISGNGSIHGATNGSSVTVIAGATGSFTLIDNINRNGCISSCIKTVTVNAIPTCSIAGADAVCSGSVGNLYTSTVSPTSGTVTHSWSISGNGTIVGSNAGATVSVTATGAGSFILTDNISRNGCISSCMKTVTVNAGPTCMIGGANAVCTNSTGNVYTSTVSPTGGTVSHNWTISGNGIIVGATNTASVSVTATAAGSFILTDNISRDGCTSSCQKTVTVNALPVCTITGDNEICSVGNTTFTATPGMASYAWTGPGNYTNNTQSITISTEGPYTVTITDANGCKSTCSRTLSFVSTPVTLSCPGNPVLGTCLPQDGINSVNSAFSSWLNSFSFSGGVNPVLTRTPANPVAPSACGGNVTVTWSVASDCGPTVSCFRTFTVNNTTPIVALTPDAKSFPACQPQADVNLSFNTWVSSFSVSGGCNPQVIVENPGAPPACGGTSTVRWTVKSNCEPDRIFQRTFTVATATSVQVNCPQQTEVSCRTQTEVNDLFAIWLTGFSSSGGCNRQVSINNPGPPSACGGVTTVTWTVTSDCEATARQCFSTFRVTAVTAPVFNNCVTGTTDLGCNPTPPVCATNITASNSCGPVTVTCSPGAITSSGCNRSQSFTYTATACGLTTTCTRTFTWQVATAPVFANCVTGTTDLGCNPTQLPVCNQNITASNECGPVQVTCSVGAITSNGCNRSQAFTYTATACGLTSTCVRTFTWQVTTAPVFDNCVSGTTDLGCNPTLPVCATNITASNSCGPVPVTCSAGTITTSGCNRSQTFTYTATACGLTTTCTRTFTWQVATAPVFSNCNQTINLGCNPASLPTCATMDAAAFGGAVTANNECGTVDVSCVAGTITSSGCTRIQTFTFTATACGLTRTCTRTFTWQVATAPVLANCNQTINLGCNPTALPTTCTTIGTAGFGGAVTASNECGTVPVSCSAGVIFINGCTRTQTFTFTATACGLTSTCTRTFTWQVATAPVFANCVTGTTDLGCNPTLPVCNNNITASNECGPVAVTCSAGAITTSGCIKTQAFTYTATACGLTSTCVRTFTWTVDPPVSLTCPQNQTITSCLTQVQIDAAYNAWLGTVSFSGGCGTQISNNSTGAPDRCGGSKLVTWTVTSACQAPRTCSATFTVTPGSNCCGICYESCTGNPAVGALQTVVDNGNTVTIRTTFAKTFVDNTYGTSVIGWPGSHSFGNLTGSDKLQLALYDANNVKKMEMVIDYLTSSSAAPSGFKTLGVTGGDGSMMLGSAGDVVNALTSLDVNLNNNGPSYYLTTNSPVTNASYAPNATYPNWIYDVWYEVTVNKSVFGATGFGYPRIASVHASPSKTGNNTECVQLCTPVSITAIGSNGPCESTCKGSIVATTANGQAPFTFAWSDGTVTTKDRSNLCPGTYTVTVTDGSGATASATAVIGTAPTTCNVCYESCTGNLAVGALQTVVDNGNTVTIRTTFAKTFVDNTYGNQTIGWPGSHSFSNLTGSDKLQLALYDANNVKKMEMEIDYLTSSSAAPSGFKTLGVTGGDGKMILGSSTDVISALTSLDVNLNTNGPSYYLTTNSPATNVSYTPNATYPNWIYDVWYEVTVNKAAFGPSGFGYPRIASVHASPSKTGNNTECVQLCSPLTVTAAGNNGPCGSINQGSIIVTPAKGQPPYTYSWNDGPVTSKDRSGLAPGIYTVTVTDGAGATTSATVTIQAAQACITVQCFESPTKPNIVNARTTYTYTPTTVTIRTTLSKTFVDNTYGNQTIGWPGSHSFGNLTGSDNLQLALFDGNNVKKMDMEIDYLTSSSAAVSGFKTLGVTGGDGKMILGSAADVVSVLTSLDVNLNSNGPAYYLTSNSPATNASYAPNATYPNWIYDVWYEVTVNRSAFGPAGFGKANIVKVHASPSKTGTNEEPVIEVPCAAPFTNRLIVSNSETATDEQIVESTVSLFPNPALNYVNISFTPGKSGNSVISLFDISGKLISNVYNGITEKSQAYIRRLDTRPLKPGVYMIKFQNGDIITTKRLVIMR